jgi:hypothetical protein
VPAEFWWGNQRERDHLKDLRRRWEGNNAMGLKSVGLENVRWIELTVITNNGVYEHGDEPLNSIKCCEFLD